MSKLETNTIDTISGTSTLQVGSTNTTTITLGASGDTINVPSGVTIANSGTATGFGGVTEADQWRLSTTLTSVTDSYITANLERVDNTGWGKIGTGMSESSGVFTFPSTGTWLVKYQFLCYGIVTPSSNWDGFVDPEIHVTTNNSSYAAISRGYAGLFDMGGNIGGNGTMIESLIDVTDTANVKVKFYINSLSSTTTIYGATDRTGTGFSFIRLGDT